MYFFICAGILGGFVFGYCAGHLTGESKGYWKCYKSLTEWKDE